MYHCTHCHKTSKDDQYWYYDGIGGQYCQNCIFLAIELLDQDPPNYQESEGESHIHMKPRRQIAVQMEVRNRGRAKPRPFHDTWGEELVAYDRENLRREALRRLEEMLWSADQPAPIWPVEPYYDLGLRCPTCNAYPGHYSQCPVLVSEQQTRMA
jgi:hypothetical protein